MSTIIPCCPIKLHAKIFYYLVLWITDGSYLLKPHLTLIELGITHWVMPLDEGLWNRQRFGLSTL